MDQDDIQDGAREFLRMGVIGIGGALGVASILAVLGYHFTASLGALEIERACSVKISWWMHLLWMVAPFGPIVLFLTLRGFVLRSTLAAALIAAALLGAVLYMDFLRVGVPSGPMGQYDTDRTSYCNLMRSVLPAR
jgi:hypothetical protein